MKNNVNLYGMLTINMGGKMEGMNSLSTACSNNSTCQARINSSIMAIRKYSPKANEIISRYLLPATDKAHITCKKAVTELEKIGCKASVCIFCYANKAQSWQKGARDKFQANGEYLKELHNSDELPPIVPAFVNGSLYFRFEAEGDSNNVNQNRNYIRIANRPENSNINCAIWTKNPEYIWKAICLEGGKPANLQIVLSSLYVNVPDLHNFERYNALCMAKFGYNLFDKLFTVWTEKGIASTEQQFNCCGSSSNKNAKCKECLNCYKRSNYNVFVNELLR